MEYINYSAASPEENIALDELMLLRAEAGFCEETLRFWASTDYFVVLGRAGKVDEECLRQACAGDKIKIIRRASGGGTVLQGPGCLNYSLVLSYLKGEEKNEIKRSYARVLNSISDIFISEGIPVKVLPVSDIALYGKKISGNAQARKRNYFLHHGTFLYDMDLARINKYLKHPPREPAYRKGRYHSDFIMNLPIGQEEIEEMILKAFPIEGTIELSSEDKGDLQKLADKKYATDEWNLQF